MARITREKFKTYENVFDNFTLRNLFKLSSQGHFNDLKSPVALGKEANVFSANTDLGPIIVKIYRLESCNFNKMFDYIKTDPRYDNLQHQRRKIIFSWVQREYRNLLKARVAGVNVPKPIAFKDSILLMEHVGRTRPAPQLKDLIPQDPEGFLEETVANMKKLEDAGLVHGDLSKFNILNLDEKPVFIDFSQATTTESYNHTELLQRDCRNIASFFNRFCEADAADIYGKITGREPGQKL